MSLIMELHEKIHFFENKKELLDFKLGCQNVPVWPLVRLNIIISCIDKRVYAYRERKRGQMKKRVNKLKEFTIKNPFFHFLRMLYI